MRDWEAMGLGVAITELDIRTVDGDREAQAAQYADVVGTCLAVEACTEVTLWGVTDRYTWLDDVPRSRIGPAPLRRELRTQARLPGRRCRPGGHRLIVTGRVRKALPLR